MGTLQYRQNFAHGNPYCRLLRTEVEAFATALHGVQGVEAQEVHHTLQKVSKEIARRKRKLASLEKQKLTLLARQKQLKA